MADLFTLDVGQGNFAVLRGTSEVIVIDTHLPPAGGRRAEFARSSLGKIAEGRKVKGVILTGFGVEHAGPSGLAMVLGDFGPEWVMYPEPRNTSMAVDEVLRLIGARRGCKAGVPERVPVCLDMWGDDPAFDRLSREFSFRAFSPCHCEEATPYGANLVLKITERATERGVLVTGDTGARRWGEMCEHFSSGLIVDALQAPQHGSMDGITRQAYHAIFPHTVLVSAGNGDQSGHPHADAIKLFKSASKCYCTPHEGSLVTKMERASIATYSYSG